MNPYVVTSSALYLTFWFNLHSHCEGYVVIISILLIQAVKHRKTNWLPKVTQLVGVRSEVWKEICPVLMGELSIVSGFLLVFSGFIFTSLQDFKISKHDHLNSTSVSPNCVRWKLPPLFGWRTKGFHSRLFMLAKC